MLPHRPWDETRDVLRLARRSDLCSVLGPGVRAVLWVQGCPFRCLECVAPETLPFRGGNEARVADLADELSARPAIEGVTFSGGEPMAQAAALAALIDHVLARRDFSFVCYTGYTLELGRLKGEYDGADRAAGQARRDAGLLARILG